MFDSEQVGRTEYVLDDDLGVLRPGRNVGEISRRCPWGHDLTLGRVNLNRMLSYQMHAHVCEICYDTHGPYRGRWTQVDTSLASQGHQDPQAEKRLHLAVTPPATPAGVGTIEFKINDISYGRVELLLCGPCRRAILHHVEVAPGARCRGVGRILISAALARGAGYSWTTTPIDHDDPVALAFWATIGTPGPPLPRPCAHHTAAGWARSGDQGRRTTRG